MYLVDTNIFLEILLAQEKQKFVRNFELPLDIFEIVWYNLKQTRD